MPAPSAPTSLAVDESAILGGWLGKASYKPGVRLTFTNNASGTAQHRLEKSVNAGSTWTLVTIADVGASVIIGGGLALSTTHYFRLRAEDGGGVSAWAYLGGGSSPGSSHVTPALPTTGSPPTAPGSVAVSSIGPSAVTVTWEDQSTNESYFIVEVRWGSRTAQRSVASFAESLRIDLADLFGYSYAPLTVASQLMSVRVLAGYQAVQSAWSSEVVFSTAAPTLLVTSPLVVTAEKDAAFSYTITSNTPATGWTVTGSLPTGLTRTGAVISGTPTVVGSTTVSIAVTDGVTTDTVNLTIIVRESSIRISSPGTATAYLGTAFTYTITGQRSNGAAAITGYSAANLPPWLTLDGADLTGTPNEPGTWTVQVAATNGTQTGFRNVTITVPPVGFTSTANIIARVGQELVFQVVTTPPEAVVSSEDLPAWLTLDGHTLRGTPDTLGEVSANLSAELDGIGGTQAITISVEELFRVPDETLGYQGDLFFDQIAYLGAGYVSQWQLSGGPPGLAVERITVGGAYTTSFFDAITGTPTAEGRFEATLSVIVRLPDESVAVYRHSIVFQIQGPLYLPWLHADPMLYDLQVDVRGDIPKRRVRSYYGTAAKAASVTVATEDTTTGGTAVTTTQNAAQPANLLTLKRGDTARLAVVVRDGRLALGDPTVANVRIAFRLQDSADEEKLFELTALEQEVAPGKIYWLIAFDVTDEMLDELMSDDSLTSFEVFAEILWEYDGYKQSSETFRVAFTEDVQRVD